MKTVLLVSLGGAIGSTLRYLLATALNPTTARPAFCPGTLLVNVLGSFAIAIVAGLFARGMVSPELRLFVVSGVLGGFTTWSSFNQETLTLWSSGQGGAAVAYVAASLAGGLLAGLLGTAIAVVPSGG